MKLIKFLLITCTIYLNLSASDYGEPQDNLFDIFYNENDVIDVDNENNNVDENKVIKQSAYNIFDLLPREIWGRIYKFANGPTAAYLMLMDKESREWFVQYTKYLKLRMPQHNYAFDMVFYNIFHHFKNISKLDLTLIFINGQNNKFPDFRTFRVISL
jgi:hypothetical protein